METDLMTIGQRVPIAPAKPSNDAPEPPQGMFDDASAAPVVIPTIGAHEIAKPLSPIDWLVEGIGLAPGAAICIAGSGYAKKTLAMQSAELSIVSGGDVWGTFRARRGRVLHLDYEQGRRLSIERYQRLAAGLHLDLADLDDNALRLAVMPDVYLDSADAPDVYARTMDGFALTVVDSLRAAAPSAEENSSEIRRHIDVLTRACEKTGGCAVFIHHARKPADDGAGGGKVSIRGSSAIFDACASVFVFSGEKGKPTRVQHEKDRIRGVTLEDFGLEVVDVAVGNDPRGGVCVVHVDREQLDATVGDDGEIRRYTALRARILKLITETDIRDSASAVWTAAKGNRAAVLAAVKDLLAEKAIRKEGGCFRLA